MVKRAKSHIDACTNVMIEMTITTENGFLTKMNHNRGIIDGDINN